MITEGIQVWTTGLNVEGGVAEVEVVEGSGVEADQIGAREGEWIDALIGEEVVTEI